MAGNEGDGAAVSHAEIEGHGDEGCAAWHLAIEPDASEDETRDA